MTERDVDEFLRKRIKEHAQKEAQIDSLLDEIGFLEDKIQHKKSMAKQLQRDSN